jgi:DNA-binding NarL/FixJ family response regulator
MIRLTIADDHAFIRHGLKRILEKIDDIDVVGEAVDEYETLAKVRRGGFDLLLLDLSMPGSMRHGMDLIRQIRLEAPTLPILILSLHDECQFVLHALRAGAQGYVVKEHAVSELVNAIREVAAGRIYISVEQAALLAQHPMAIENNQRQQNIHKWSIEFDLEFQT